MKGANSQALRYLAGACSFLAARLLIYVVHPPSNGYNTVPPGRLSQNTLNFMKQLAIPANNDKDWFWRNEAVYRVAQKVILLQRPEGDRSHTYALYPLYRSGTPLSTRSYPALLTSMTRSRSSRSVVLPSSTGSKHDKHANRPQFLCIQANDVAVSVLLLSRLRAVTDRASFW